MAPMDATLLLVEDDASVREVTQVGLQRAGFTVLTARDGNEGLSLFRSRRPDAVVLDIMLPGLDGLEVCRVIRRDSSVPVVMLTALAGTIDVVVGLEARGFILGGAVAHGLGKGFVPIRKAGKLPYKTESHEYALEYGTDRVEVHVDAIDSGARVLVVDDLLATGGTALAAARLVEKLGGRVVEMAFIVDLPDVGGRKRLEAEGYTIFALCEFEGD